MHFSEIIKLQFREKIPYIGLCFGASVLEILLLSYL